MKYPMPALAAVLLLLAGNSHAVSLGIGTGYTGLSSAGQSNVEKAYLGTQSSTSSPNWALTLQAQYGITDWLFCEAGLSTFGYLEKDQTHNYIKNVGAKASKTTSMESADAIHTALGLAYFVNQQLAVYAKAGAYIHESTYMVRQVISVDNNTNQIQEDSQTSANYMPRLYGGVGAFYNISDIYSLKVEYEEFGVMGNHAKVNNVFIPNTTDNPRAAGVYVKRYMVHFLIRSH